MLKMSSQIETIVSAYKTLVKIPSLIGAKVNSSGSRINSKWSVRNLDKGKSTKYSYSYFLDDKFDVIAQSDFGTDVSNELLSTISPSEQFKAIIREEKDSKDTKKQYLEVWTANRLTRSIDLTALDVHGDVYADSEFGGLQWSPDESAVVYVAEKKLPKSEPYIKRKPAKDAAKAEEGSGEAPVKKGEEYIYRQDWGEQLAGKHLSVMVVCQLQTETITVLQGLPDSWCPGQVCFTADGKSVLGVAWQTEPRQLGLIFCTNRPSCVFQITLDGQLTILSGEGKAVRSPRVAAGGALWLQRAEGGPHHAAHDLILYRGDTKQSRTVIPAKITTSTSNGHPFYGIYSQALPLQCWAKDGRRIILSTPQQNEVRSYVVDTESGSIVEISNKSRPCSTSVLDVNNDIILASCTDMTTPAQLFIARLPPLGSEADIIWKRVSDPIEVPSCVANASVQYMELEHKDSQDTVKSFTALCLLPQSEGVSKAPLVAWPHGGPHTGFVNAYSLEAALFTMLGFASLQINYRGSTGQGQASVEFIPSRVGDADVKDCKYATEEAVKLFKLDETKLCLFGGSHGGFLVAHLSGQYPDVFRAVVSRNPVVDIATMINYTDIPDCLASLRINFRGSTGYGDEKVRCLLGNVGTYDVQDCLLAINTVLQQDDPTLQQDDSTLQEDDTALQQDDPTLQKYDTTLQQDDSTLQQDDPILKQIETYLKSGKGRKLLLYGGSYGGFVATHLAGRCDIFKAMVLRNPLIDLATKGHCADNSEGCAVETGFEFTEKGPTSEEELLRMRRCSPLTHAHKVRAPTALMLGSLDKRVPYYQGLEYYRRLKANGVKARIYLYEDNHSLSLPAVEMDNLINSAAWLLDNIQ